MGAGSKVAQTNSKEALHSTNNEGWEEVKKRGKKVIADPSPIPSLATASQNASASTANNPFDALSHLDSVEDPVEENLALAIVSMPLQVDKLLGDGEMKDKAEMDSFSTPLGDGQNLMQNVTFRGRKEEGLELGRGTSPFSDCSSVPINNPLIQKVRLVDEVERKNKKNRRKDGQKGGSGEASGNFSS